MDAIKQEKLLSRSKSTGYLDKLDNEFDYKCFAARLCGYSGNDNPHASLSSVECCDEAESSAEENKVDSGIGKNLFDVDPLLVLDQKIDKLSELLQEQHNLLCNIQRTSMKEYATKSKVLRYPHLTVNTNTQNCAGELSTDKSIPTNETVNVQVTADDEVERSDDAIDIQKEVSLDHIIRVALENFLQSDRVRDHVSTATAECVMEAVHDSFCRVVSTAYLPLVQRSHRRLFKHVTQLLRDSFADLEEGTASLFKSIHKSSKNIRMSLEKHQNLLEATDPVKYVGVLQTTLRGVLEEELRTWRERLVQELSSQPSWGSAENEPEPPYEWVDDSPTSPPQPANPGTSIIDSLMKSAIITKHVQDGDIAGAFEEALSSADLSLVMAACRAAGPAGACALRPAALLSLLQQLATDMLHDSQLKCRYLEEAILRLEKCDAATRQHLPLVAREVRRHLSAFLTAYPKHRASRRIALIVMAANNLLK